MKHSKMFCAIIGMAASLLAFAIPAFAIEGLQLSVQSSNVLLSWPSATNETYIAQYRGTLSQTDMWLTLTDGFPAALNTNVTVFIESNAVQYPVEISSNSNGGGGGGGGLAPPGATNSGPGVLFSTPTGFYRVVQDGVQIFGLTNGMVLSGNVQLPIEFAMDITDEIVGVTFYDTNDNPIIGASATPGPGGGWVLNWNTSIFPNGTDAIEAELDFATNDPVVSVPVTVTVSNVISFPNYLTQLFGSQMWIYAQTIPDADVEIDIYDENTNYLGSFYPESDDNGIISFLWDLTDGNGNTFEDTNFFGVFTVDTGSDISRPATQPKPSGNGQSLINPHSLSFQTLQPSFVRPAVGGGSASAVQLWVQEPAWTPNNQWVVAMADLTGDPSIDQAATYMVVGGNGSPTDYYGVLGTLDAYGLNGNVSPGNNAQNGNVFTLQDTNTRSELLNYLPSTAPRYENFYFFGHGTESSIGAYNYPITAITMDQLAFALGNVPLSYGNNGTQMRLAALHPYRFVWIDACDTGKANFCEAFGIPAQDLSTNNFAAAGLESRVFLGFKNVTGFDTSNSSGDPNGWPARSTTTGIMLYAWLHSTASIAAIVYAAQQEQPPNYALSQSAVTYGATDMFGNTHTP